MTHLVSQVYDKNPEMTLAAYEKMHEIGIPLSSTIYQYGLMCAEMNHAKDALLQICFESAVLDY